MRRVLLLAALLGIALGAAPAAAQDPVPPPAPPLTEVRYKALDAVLDVRRLLAGPKVSAEEYEATRNACETLPADDLLLVRFYNVCQGHIDLDQTEQFARTCSRSSGCRSTIQNMRKRLAYYREVAEGLNAVLPTEVPDPECAAALAIDAAELAAIGKLQTTYGKVARALRDGKVRTARSLLKRARTIKGRPTDARRLKRFRAGCV